LGPSPTREFPVVQGLGLYMGRIDKMRMGRAQFPCKFVQCVVPNDDAVRKVEYAVVCVEVFDGGAPAAASPCPKTS
jgi:hypothetical protein